MFNMFKARWVARSVAPTPAIVPQLPEISLLEEQLATAGQDHGEWALKYYLQLKLDGLPEGTAAKLTSFKFFGSYIELI